MDGEADWFPHFGRPDIDGINHQTGFRQGSYVLRTQVFEWSVSHQQNQDFTLLDSNLQALGCRDPWNPAVYLIRFV
jgi:hypothetical protein